PVGAKRWRWCAGKIDRHKDGPGESEGRDALPFWLVMNAHGLFPNRVFFERSTLEADEPFFIVGKQYKDVRAGYAGN
ncbi:MAG: hypothetical protein ACOCVU_07835, partial [Desulfohalobiaceae bacterium]